MTNDDVERILLYVVHITREYINPDSRCNNIDKISTNIVKYYYFIMSTSMGIVVNIIKRRWQINIMHINN